MLLTKQRSISGNDYPAIAHPHRPFHLAICRSTAEIRAHAQFLLENYDVVDEQWSEDHDLDADLRVLAKDPMCLTCEEALMALVCVSTKVKLELMGILAGFDGMKPQIFHTRGPADTTLFHLVAFMWAWFNPSRRNESVLRHTLLKLMSQGLKAGADIHALDASKHTPFDVLLLSSNNTRVNSMSKTICTWVGALAGAGVDLQHYGAVEARIGRRDGMGSDISISQGREFLGLQYGPRPEDWHTWWMHAGDGFAGHFWNMIENPELRIPGAWVDVAQHRERWEVVGSRTRYRYSGVKRKSLRKIRGEIKLKQRNHQQQVWNDVDGLAELYDEVKRQAKDWEAGTTPNYLDLVRMRDFARCLGVIRADWV